MANYNVTIAGANVSPLVKPEQSQGGYTVRYQIPYTTLTTSGASAAADTVSVILGTTPATWIVSSLLVDIPVAFAGTAGASATTCTIGTTTTATAFASSFSLLSAGVYQPPNGPNTVATPSAATGTSTITMQAVVTQTCGLISGFTTGFMTILLGLYDPTATP